MHPLGQDRTLVLGDELLDGHQQRRIADESGLPIDHLGELVQRLHTVACTRFSQRLVGLGLGLGEGLVGMLLSGQSQLVTQVDEHLLDVHAGVPHVEIPHRGQLGHLRAVTGDGIEHHVSPLLVGESAIAPGDGQTGRQPLHVPFPWTGQCFVEVVDVEHQVPLRRGEDAEVAEVSVPAGLDVQARTRSRGQIGRHDQCRTPVEGERRDQHPAVTNGHEFLDP
jgi:hypothetical protein